MAALTALSIPAAAQTQTVYVRLADGSVVPVTVDVPPGSSLDDIQLPGTPVPAPAPPTPTTPTTPSVPKPPETNKPAPAPQDNNNNNNNNGPTSDGGSPQDNSNSGRKVKQNSDGTRELVGEVEGRAKDEISRAKRRGRRSPLRNADGSPTTNNPGFVDVLPGPSTATGVPNFIIRKFRVPPFLLSIYRPPGSSTASAGRSSRRSTRSRRTTAAT